MSLMTGDLPPNITLAPGQWVRLNAAGDGFDTVAITSPIAKTFTSPSRSVNTAFQISSSQDAEVSYSVDITTALTLSGGAAGTVYLEYADDSGFTTNVKEVAHFTTSNTGTLVVGITLNQQATARLGGVIPAGKYVRLRTNNTTGTPTYGTPVGEEVLV